MSGAAGWEIAGNESTKCEQDGDGEGYESVGAVEFVNEE
jgi:hypothetical protein